MKSVRKRRGVHALVLTGLVGVLTLGLATQAMACGCPVAVSDIPAHREICRGTAMYFDPFSPEDISSKLDALLRLDPATRRSLIECGLRCAATYCWENSASETWRVLEDAAGK